MDLKQRILWQLQTIRQYDEQLLPAFQSPEDWTHQIFPGANHALWVVGHLAIVDNGVLGRLFPGNFVDRPVYAEKFGRQSKPSPNPADYPSPKDVLDFFRQRRTTLLDCIENLADPDFEQPVPPPKPPFIHTAAQMFLFLAIHEGLHMGQLSLCRRSKGHAPIV